MKIEAKELHGANIFLDMVSVGATINIMLAVHATGQTVIENATKEPEVVDVANFLNSLGADIKGAGTSTLKLMVLIAYMVLNIKLSLIVLKQGHTCIAAVGEEITINNIVPKHVEALTVKLKELGVDIQVDGDL